MIFTNNQETDCPITSCDFKESDCVSTFTQPNVFLGAGPDFSITVSELVPEGYFQTFCYSCVVTPTKLAPIATFTKHMSIV